MENKNNEKYNKIILGDFNCAIDKMNKDGGKKNTKNLWMSHQLCPVKTHRG